MLKSEVQSELNKPQQHQRRFWRYSLRTLLIVVTLICLGGGWYLGRVRNQQTAVRWVKQRHGRVEYRVAGDEKKPQASEFEQWVVDNLGPDYIWPVVEVYVDGDHKDQATDIGPMQYLPKLRKIQLHACDKLSNISALAACQDLESLTIETSSVEKIDSLAGLQKLKEVAISRTPLQDLTPLAQCPALEVFFIEHTLIDKLDALANLPKLKDITVSLQAKMPDMSALANHQSLEIVVVLCKDCRDIKFVSGLRQLKSLTINGTQVADLSPVRNCPKLIWLDISGTKIRDISPLANLSQLGAFVMNETEIVDISALSCQLKLQSLSAKGTKIADLEPLISCKKISSLDLSGTPLKDPSPLKRMRKLEYVLIPYCNISQQVLDELRESLPQCRFVHELDP